MAGRVEGKVAFITGAARGQGRSHAIRLAQEGADIIAIDICQQIDSVPYGLASAGDLEQTVKDVEALGQRIVATETDVRDYAAVKAALDAGVSQLGGLHIVSANAGIFSRGTVADLDQRSWQDMIDVNLTGVWHTVKAAIPHLRATGGGSIILTSSNLGLKGVANAGHYVAAKHGVVGLMRTLALELAPEMIRVNCLNPTTVNTDMIQNSLTYELFAPDVPAAERTPELVAERFKETNTMPVPYIEPVDVSNALLWLASDEARYVTGVNVPVDAGSLLK